LILLGTLASLLLTLAWAGLATADVVYLYDDLGRLVRVIREDGEAATYHYDASGNLLRIARESGVPQTTTVTGISTSTLQQNSSTTLTLTGFNLGGAAVSASAGITVTAVQSDAGTLTIQVSVGDAAPLGPASLAIETALGTVTVPLTIIPVLATSIQLSIPFGVAVDGRGNLFIADTGHNRVRTVSPDGASITVAGDGTAGFGGDGGPATSARLNFPTDVAVGGPSVLFIVDEDNNRIRRVSPDGIITTVAGSGVEGFGGDGSPAISARLDEPHSVVADAAGNLYIADTDNHRIRKVSPDGTITTVAGTSIPGFSGDGGLANSAQLNLPAGVAVDEQGNLFIADLGNHRIRKVGSDGIITTVAGSEP
jgi:YD repeat-containing protein